VRRTSPRAVLVCMSFLVAAWIASSAFGAGLLPSTRLVNLDAGLLIPEDEWLISADIRAMAGDDDNVYGNVRIGWGISSAWEVDALLALSDRQSFATGRTTLFYGGNDVELRVKYRLCRHARTAVAIESGWEFPDTPAQDDVHSFIQVPLSQALGRDVTGHVVPKWDFLSSNALFTIGLGLEARLSDHVHVLGDYTPMIDGDNTRNASGALSHRDVWGAAIRWLPHGDEKFSIDVGATNGKGQTTDFGFAPGILDSSAFYAAFNWRP
jgi:hypothetical protein